MTNISRYILRHLFWWAMLVTFTLTCVVWLTQSLRFVYMIVNRGLSAPLFIWLTTLLLPTFLLIILPIAVFSAVLFTYNKLIADSEMVVLRSAGLSQWALSRPALALAALTTLLCYFLSLYLVPTSFRAFKDLQRKYRSTYSSVLLQEGVFNPVMKGVTVFIRARNANGELLGIVVHDSRNPDRPVTMMAERGAIMPAEKGPRVVMRNGSRQEVQSDDGRLNLLNFDRYVFDIAEKAAAQEGSLWRDPNERFIHELLRPPDSRFSVLQHQKYLAEAHHRLAAPMLAISFVLVGVAFLLGGEFNRRGQWRRILGATLVVVAVEATMIGLKNLSVKTPELAITMYVVALLPAAIGLYALGTHPRRPKLAAPPTASA